MKGDKTNGKWKSVGIFHSRMERCADNAGHLQRGKGLHRQPQGQQRRNDEPGECGAELASEDATAQAAGKTGGYGNSWASTNGQTAYQSTMAGLSNAVDDLYSQAFDEYTSKKNDLTTRLEALQKQEQLAQDAYNTKLNNYYSRLNNAQAEYAAAVGEKQQNTANKTKFWGNVAQVGAMALPWVLRAMGVPI